MEIAKITTQKKRTDRYNVYIFVDGKEEYAFSVDEDVLIKWQLRKGIILSEEDVVRILEQDEARKAWNDTLQYITHSMRTEYQIKQHLRKKEYEEEAIIRAIEKAKNYRYVDDLNYANSYVRTKMKTTDKGPAIISQELKEKGVHLSFIETALEQFTPSKQLESALQFLEKKANIKRHDSSQAFKKRMLESLVRKGFSTEIALESWEASGISLSREVEKAAVQQSGEKAVKKWKKKYSGSELEWKVKEVLYRKGFSLSDIEEFLREQEMEDHGETL